MNYFALLQGFIELCLRAASADELLVAFGKAVGTLGFRYFACYSHVDLLRPPPSAVVLCSYPAAWVRQYTEERLFQRDPILRLAETTLLPFSWDDAFRPGLTREERDILTRAAEFGIVHGFTIPIHPPAARAIYTASCSVVPDSLAVEVPSYFIAQLMAYHLYDAASRQAAHDAEVGVVELSNRERQCLELVAQGKSDWVVGKLLSISERTVHNHIERAKRRLGVSTRVQAIVHALATRQINLGDVVKAESVRTHAGPITRRHRSDA